MSWDGVDRAAYRELIDELVEECRHFAGAKWAREGSWSPADPDADRFLASLGQDEREVVARVLASAFESGVHQTLALLYAREIAPFDEDHQHEGTPFHDFMGRCQGLEWPDED